MLVEDFSLKMVGRIRIYERQNPDVVLFDSKNVIVNTVKSLFARLMANSTEPEYGIWGLAIGSGDSGWGNTPPDGLPTQTSLLAETKRKQKSGTRFIDPITLNPVTGFSEAVEIQTLFNATNDNITSPVREMGLIGGGTTIGTPTDMTIAPYWDPVAKNGNSVTLINYKTLPTLTLPAGVDLVFSWILQF